MAGSKAKITKRTVDAEPVPATGEPERWLWDTELKGFFLRVYSSGRKVYGVKCRAAGRQRIHTIGEHGAPWRGRDGRTTTLTPDLARGAAADALGLARAGEDPNAERQAARDALTVTQLIERYLEDGPATKPAKRASTWGNDASNLNRHIKPLLGPKIANSVTKADAARAVRDVANGVTAVTEKSEKKRGKAVVKGGAGVARRTRMTAAAMFAWGIEHGLAKTNPFAAVKLSAAPVKERFLSKAEAAGFLGAINDLETSKEVSSTFGDALRLLLLTGARKTEILGLRWSEIDHARKNLVLPPERTKAGGKTGERRVALSAPALQILTRRREAEEARAAKVESEWIKAGRSGERPNEATPSIYVFPAGRGDGHAIGLRRAFVRVCEKAKLENLRVHDLRHSFASFAIADGASLFLIAKLLGHASARTTERYAHLSNDPLQDAVDQLGRQLIPPPVADEDASSEEAKARSAEVIEFDVVARAQ